LVVRETKPALPVQVLLPRSLLPFYPAGFVNNFNDAMVWGLIGLIATVYPLDWSVS
jgi:hypothetical protein